MMNEHFLSGPILVSTNNSPKKSDRAKPNLKIVRIDGHAPEFWLAVDELASQLEAEAMREYEGSDKSLNTVRVNTPYGYCVEEIDHAMRRLSGKSFDCVLSRQCTFALITIPPHRLKSCS